MRRWLIIAAFFILTCGASGVAITGSAEAAPVHTTASVTPAAQHAASQVPGTGVIPDTINFFYIDFQGSMDGLACNGGTVYLVTTQQGELGINNCNVRVWLHEHADSSGVTECFGPHVEKPINATYRNAQITSNTAPCL